MASEDEPGVPLLSVRDLKTHFRTEDGVVRAVDGVSFDVHPGQILGIVGETGCGKSVTARSILRIVQPGRIVDGQILLDRDGDGEQIDLARLPPNGQQMRSIRGGDIALVFQEPMASFSPVHTVGNQIIEAVRLHQQLRGAAARRRAVELLAMVGVPGPDGAITAYPWQLSGGLQQRAMIAMALAGTPRLLIADEPTTALDVTTQAQILNLLRDLRQRTGMAIMLITHDLGVIAEMADDVVVMYQGRVVEKGPVDTIFHAPSHPYTQALLGSIPSLQAPARAPRQTDSKVLLEVSHLRKFFPVQSGQLGRVRGYVRAVDDVSFDLYEGETLALVGESGSGKTTTARCILRAIDPDSGTIRFRTPDAEVDLATLGRRQLRCVRPYLQLIFQDPYSSLNPRMTVLDIVSEPLLVNGMGKEDRIERATELLDLVGLPKEYLRRFPHAFSGGQRQRIGIARALALNPRLVVADEPVSALDVSVRAQILKLMLDLQQRLGLSYLFVSHDLSVVKHISDRVAVMYVGQLVELGNRDDVLNHPLHPYTASLLAAVPRPDPRLRSVAPPPRGDVADPARPPDGCYFHPRCAYAIDRCTTETPAWQNIAPGRAVRCHRAAELDLVR
jgi:peptide/nickel transport system ATP-binding protein